MCKYPFAMDTVDPVARTLGAVAVVLWLVTIAIGWVSLRRSGGRLKVRARVQKHQFDPLQHRVRIQVVNVGLLPITVKGVGLQWRPSSETGSQLLLTLDAGVTEGSLPKELSHSEDLFAEVTYADIGRRWSWNASFSLTAWAEARGGQTATQWWPVYVKTPRPPPDQNQTAGTAES